MSMQIQGMMHCVLVGYLLTVLIETSVLTVGLQRAHSWKTKLLAGLVLTGCSYPFVCFVFPHFFPPSEPASIYFWVAESFAPLSECLIFWLFFNKMARNRGALRDTTAIVCANLLSFAVGEFLKQSQLIQFNWY